uniref:HAT C-terminal dimerisation domain-containing protein n=1 Tax=Ciona intestinalis TaxID=7719 RepID=H2XQP6_CIOIN
IYKRKYNPEYIKYGFISIKHQGEDLPQCVVCMKTVLNGAMKPSLLKRHLESNQPEKNDRNQSYFERLGENVKKRRLDQTGQNYQKMTGIVKASYEVSLLVAQNLKAHTIAETLILPAAKVLVRQLIGEKDVAKLESVSLSNDTVKRRINVKLVNVVKASALNTRLFARLWEDLGSNHKCLLYHTEHGLINTRPRNTPKLKCLSITEQIGVTFNHVRHTSKFYRQFSLAKSLNSLCISSKTTPQYVRCGLLKPVLKNDIGYWIKHKHQPFVSRRLCLDPVLLLITHFLPEVFFVKAGQRLFLKVKKWVIQHIIKPCTEVRWLSRGNMTRQIFELKNELLVFCKQKNSDFQNDLENEEFKSKLAYLSDIFETLLSDIFESLNNTKQLCFRFSPRLEAFIRKLDIWKKNMDNRKYGILLTSLQSQPSDKLSSATALKSELMHYFPDMTCCAYITNPFLVVPSLLPVGTGEQEDIIDIQSDETAKTLHKESSPINVWLNMASTYETLAGNAIPQLLVFPSTWECEQGFSSMMMSIKTKSRNRLEASGHDFRCAVNSVAPRIDLLAARKQLPPSH